MKKMILPLFLVILSFESNAKTVFTGKILTNRRAPASSTISDSMSKKLVIKTSGTIYEDKVMVGENASYSINCSGKKSDVGELKIYPRVSMQTFRNFANEDLIVIDTSKAEKISSLKFESADECKNVKALLEQGTTINPSKLSVIGNQFTVEN